MWTAQSSESSSESLQLLNMRSTSDLSVESLRPNVTAVGALECQKGTTDCHAAIDVDPSSFQAREETAVCSETMETTRPNLDDNDAPVRRQCDSHVDSIPATALESCGYNNPHTLSPEHLYQQQQQQQQPHQPVVQTMILVGNQLSAAATQTCSRATLTPEEQRLFAGGKCCLLTCNGRRLRHIAPKPTATYTDRQPTLPPRTTFKLVLGPPSQPAATTTMATTSTPSNSNTGVKYDTCDKQPPSTGKTVKKCIET